MALVLLAPQPDSLPSNDASAHIARGFPDHAGYGVFRLDDWLLSPEAFRLLSLTA